MSQSIDEITVFGSSSGGSGNTSSFRFIGDGNPRSGLSNDIDYIVVTANQQVVDADQNGIPDDVDALIFELADAIGNGNGQIDPEEQQLVEDLDRVVEVEYTDSPIRETQEGILEIYNTPSEIIQDAVDQGMDNLEGGKKFIDPGNQFNDEFGGPLHSDAMLYDEWVMA